MAELRTENLALGRLRGQSDIYAFGSNPNLNANTLEDLILWGGLYQFQTVPSELYATSTSALDVGIVCVATLLDENWGNVTVAFVLDGLNPVQLVAPDGRSLFIRGNLCFNSDPAGVATIGDVYVGTDPAPVGGIQSIPNRVSFFSSLEQQSNSAVFSVPRKTHVLLHAIIVTSNRSSGTSSSTDILLRTRNINQGPFRVRTQAGVQTGGTSIFSYNLPIPVDISGREKAGTDVVLSCISSANNVAVGGGFLIQMMEI